MKVREHSVKGRLHAAQQKRLAESGPPPPKAAASRTSTEGVPPRRCSRGTAESNRIIGQSNHNWFKQRPKAGA